MWARVCVCVCVLVRLSARNARGVALPWERGCGGEQARKALCTEAQEAQAYRWCLRVRKRA